MEKCFNTTTNKGTETTDRHSQELHASLLSEKKWDIMGRSEKQRGTLGHIEIDNRKKYSPDAWPYCEPEN